ncbi:MAG: hypothetical protein ACPGXK_06930 [Phycisphaerae bacterium]
MKRFFSIMTVLAFAGSAFAADLSLTVRQAGGSSAANVSAGEVVDYEVVGILSDTNNEGLALFGFTLAYDGGDLAQASAPAGDITDGFVSPNGINNPAGFGGTIINGDLVQVGGGQNTIKNTIDNAPFPIGVTVFTGLGHTEIVLATGSLMIPGDAANDDVFNLNVSDVFANVIKQGETGMPFYKTEAAGVGSLTNLEMTVAASEVCELVSASNPNTCSIDAGAPSNPDGSGSFGADSVVLNFDCQTSGIVDPADIGVTGGNAPSNDGGSNVGMTVELDLSGPIDAGVYTCFSYTVGETCVGYLPGDVDGNGTSDGSDIIAMTNALTGGTAPDIDRGGDTGPEDLLRVIDLLNGGGSYDVWFGQSLGNCPS